jgi:L-alanine-DL-glutamate epimerase-like enolase superfamily enzyme
LDAPVPDDDLAPMWQQWADRGFTAVKVKGGADVDHDIDRMRIAKEVFSHARPSQTTKPAIFYDVNESWSPAHAVSRLRRIAQAGIDLTWIEEPARRWDATGLKFVRDHGGTAVASGENLTGLEQFLPLVEAGSLDVVQTGSCWGITHALRVGMLAFSHNLAYSPVGYNANPVAAAAAALPNHMTTEIQSLTPPLGISVDQSLEDGGIVLGDTPGLGFSIDETAIEAHRQSAPWRTQAGPHVRPASTGFALTFEK